jgi:hypothetical protein
MGLLSDVKIDGAIIKDTLSGFGGLLKDVKTLITGKLDPDKEAELFQKMDDMESQSMNAQVEINKIEAASADKFTSRWRPFIGWVCGVSLASYYIPQALFASFLWLAQCVAAMKAAADIAALTLPTFPVTFNMNELLGLVLSLLGLGGLRSWDRKNRLDSEKKG